MKKTMSQIRPLTESELMTEVTVVQMKLDASEQEKLSQLGLAPEEEPSAFYNAQ